MNRPLAFICALFLTSLSVSSACFAGSPTDTLRFTLEPARGSSGKIQATFHRGTDPRNVSNWSTGFMPSDLIGLEVSPFHAPGSRPLRFAIVREAGRLDCAGTGGGSRASGTCRFTADAGFAGLLASRGIGRPTAEQAFGLMAVNVRRELIETVAAARYPTPSIDDLMALSALGANAAYIAAMSRAGYRPQSIQKLIEFKALGITPEWIAGFARVGYANVPGDGLVQMRALGITPEFIMGFQRIGYTNLPVSKLVELKALGITPEFVQSVVRAGEPLPPTNKLVGLKRFGTRR